MMESSSELTDNLESEGSSSFSLTTISCSIVTVGGVLSIATTDLIRDERLLSDELFTEQEILEDEDNINNCSNDLTES